VTDVLAKFVARPYQQKALRAFLIDGVKRFLIVAHRRSGKDTMSFQMLWMGALMRPGLYYHLLPKIGQSMQVVWHGKGKDGTGFREYIPKEVVAQVNHSTMTITLVNGSRIRITGADNYEALIGSNPLGIVFSEMQSIDVRAWSYLRPILAENNGFAIFLGTPRGLNAFYDLYESTKDNPSWHTEVLTVDDTRNWNGTPVISSEIIDEERRAGMSEEIIQQEFFCDWTSAIQNSYFSNEMKIIREKNNIREFELDKNLLIFTSWDLGISDSMCVGFYQCKPNGDIHCFDYIEESGHGLEYYIDQLHLKRQQYGFTRYGTHFFPHDVKVRELGTGKTRFELLRKAGLEVYVVPRTSIQERIQCARSLLPEMVIHPRCKRLIRCLDEFHAKQDEKKGISTGPNHDWSSHGADCLTYFATGFLHSVDPERARKITSYAKLYPISSKATANQVKLG